MTRKPLYQWIVVFATGLIGGGLIGFVLGGGEYGGLVQQGVKQQPDLELRQEQPLRIQLDALSKQNNQLKQQLEKANQALSLLKPTADDSDASSGGYVDSDGDNKSGELLVELLDTAAGTKRPYLIADYDKAMLRLAEAGFSAFDAEVIFELESAAQKKVAALFDDKDSNNRRAIIETIREVGAQMHAQLGDYGYENYLKSNGQSASVYIAKVADGTAGQQAGLQRGDRILRYGGERVFDIYELNSVTAKGIPGQMVEIQVQRGEQINTMLIPRGVIGITSRPRMPAQFFNLDRPSQ